MRTIAYVDGYNLYHGRLKHTPFKWLDLAHWTRDHILYEELAANASGDW